MVPQESDDEKQARLLREFVEQHGVESTQDRLGELSVLAQINDIMSSLLDVVHEMTKHGKTLSDQELRTRILQTMRKVRMRSIKIEDLVPRASDARRDTTVPPKPGRRGLR